MKTLEKGGEKAYTRLIPDLTGVDPDDAFSTVPYEKGYALLYYLEKLLGGPGICFVSFVLFIYDIGVGLLHITVVFILHYLSVSAFPFYLWGYYSRLLQFFYHFWNRSPRILQQPQSVFKGVHRCRF